MIHNAPGRQTRTGGDGVELYRRFVCRARRVRIRVIVDEYQRESRSNRYKYAVMLRKRPYFQAVDIIYSDESIHLSGGHTYDVRVNDHTRRPSRREAVQGGRGVSGPRHPRRDRGALP